jgi:hypothetical protein
MKNKFRVIKLMLFSAGCCRSDVGTDGLGWSAIFLFQFIIYQTYTYQSIQKQKNNEVNQMNKKTPTKNQH